ncbi:MAG: 30S ribosome-binding factor RbfA [Alphaproteobacteria bacterium]|nr:30S ribosome-binding factor RbfA [Alphaproteobacteria bacterium]
MNNKQQTSRQKKVAELIKQSLANAFARKRGLHIDLIKHNITITDVRMSVDLKYAHCYFLPFIGSSIDAPSLLAALENSKMAIRHQVTESIKLRYSPEIRFYHDQAAENAMEVGSTLHKLSSQII